MVVAAMTIVAIVTTPAVTSLVTKMSVPAGMIRMTSQASPDRQGMPAAVTVPMLHPPRVPRVRLATAVMAPHAAVAVAIPELGQLIARGEGRNQRDGLVVLIDPRAAMRSGVTVPRRSDSRAQPRRREDRDRD